MNASLFQDKLAFFMRDGGLQAEAGENIFAHSCDLPRVTPEQLIRLRISSFLCSMRYLRSCRESGPRAQGQLGIYAAEIRRIYKASMLKSLYCCRSSAFRL